MIETGSMPGVIGPEGVFWSVKAVHDNWMESFASYN